MTALAETPKIGKEVVTFHAGSQEFCIDIQDIREIRGWTPITSLPHAPDYILGVMNLRGSVVPIFDLSARLGLGPTIPGPRHVVIIIAANGKVAGLLVSAVSRMQEVKSDVIQAFPTLGQGASSSFVIGLIPTENGMLRLLDLAQVMPSPLQG